MAELPGPDPGQPPGTLPPALFPFSRKRAFAAAAHPVRAAQAHPASAPQRDSLPPP